MIFLMKFYLLLTGKYLDFTFQRLLMIAQLLKYPWFFFKSSDDLKKRVTKKKFTFSKKFKWFEFANLRIIRFLSTTLKCHIVSYTMCYSQLIQNEFVLQNSWRKVLDTRRASFFGIKHGSTYENHYFSLLNIEY